MRSVRHDAPSQADRALDYDVLADALVRLAMALFRQPVLRADLERLVRQVRRIPSCSGVSISLLADGESTTVVVTDRVTLEVDLVDCDVLGGLRLAALDGQSIRVAFVPEDQTFRHRAVGAGDRRVRNVLSIPVRQGGLCVGTLDVYFGDGDAFDPAAVEAARGFAGEAAAALVGSPIHEEARSIRHRIQKDHDIAAQVSMAQGVLMENDDCSAGEALTLIRQASDTNHEQLVQSAQRILNIVQ